MVPTRLLIVGEQDGAHLGGSLQRAARSLDIDARVTGRGSAYEGSRIFRKLLWHFADRRPPRLTQYNIELEKLAAALKPQMLIATGTVPVVRDTLSRLRAANIFTVNYSTDDPFNAASRSSWFLQSLPSYDAVFTPRHANESDLKQLGCRHVQYLPFAYDPDLWVGASQPCQEGTARDVVFVGGADRDRADFFSRFRSEGVEPVLYGAYWDRYVGLARLSRGIAGHLSIGEITARAAVNICLVRRANRDGHVMRTFEIPAIGGFMIAEDTSDHRHIFGPEGECVLYFRSPTEAAQKAQWALNHPKERQAMARRGHDRVVRAPNTYTDRLQQMLSHWSANA